MGGRGGETVRHTTGAAAAAATAANSSSSKPTASKAGRQIPHPTHTLSYTRRLIRTHFVRTYTHTHIHTYTHAYTHTHMHTYTHTHTHAYTYTHTHIHIHRHRHTDTQTHRHTHTLTQFPPTPSVSHETVGSDKGGGGKQILHQFNARKTHAIGPGDIIHLLLLLLGQPLHPSAVLPTLAKCSNDGWVACNFNTSTHIPGPHTHTHPRAHISKHTAHGVATTALTWHNSVCPSLAAWNAQEMERRAWLAPASPPKHEKRNSPLGEISC